MPGPSDVSLGSVKNSFVLSVTVAAGAALATGPSVEERTYTVPGLALGDIVTVNPPSFVAAVIVGVGRVSAVNTLAITFIATAGTPSIPAGTYLVQVDRSMYPTIAQIPTAIT